MSDTLKYVIVNWMENVERAKCLELNIFIAHIIYYWVILII